MSFEIKGLVHHIGDTNQVTDTFKKRDLVVKYSENPQFEEFIKFEATQDRTSLFDGLSIGDEVEVSWNLRGKEWTNKDGVTSYFNSLVAWKVKKTGSATAVNQAPPTVDLSTGDGKDDDLPF